MEQSHENANGHDNSNMNHESMRKVQLPNTSLKDFIPLIVIFGIIILFTALRVVIATDPDLMFVMRNFMGGFFIVFGGFKVFNWKGFVQAYSIYDLIAKRSKVYGYIYPLMELALGIAYLTAFNPVLTNWVTLLLMLIGALGVAKELMKGSAIPCACLGAVFKIPMTKVTLMEDLLMAGMALWMLFLI